MRTQQEENSINRVLKARGLPSLDEPGVIAHLAYQVEDHLHFTQLLKACEPALRREMYEAMKPHLRFEANPLEDYIIAAKEHASTMQLPTINPDGTLSAYSQPEAVVPLYELTVQCFRCERERTFSGERKADAIQQMRHAGWGFDESVNQRHYCGECLDLYE